MTRWLTTSEVAKELHVTTETVRSYCHRDLLVYSVRIRRFLIDPRSVVKFKKRFWNGDSKNRNIT